jgi:hypothetical protein
MININIIFRNEAQLLVVVDEIDWNNRLAKLKEKVDYYLKKKSIKNNSTKYLFYDTFPKSVVKTILKYFRKILN